MIINFGSINIDHVYKVATMPNAGETISCSSYERYLGGKGVNQSIAASMAGAEIAHVGAVGADGTWANNQITSFGVSTERISVLDQANTGHAIITVDQNGENQIVIASGANREFTRAMVDDAFSSCGGSTGWVLLQNETNLADYIVSSANASGWKVAYAAAPFDAEVTLSLLDNVDLLAVNEGEAAALAKEIGAAREEIPVPQLLVTLGSEGAILKNGNEITEQPAFKVEPVDTTGAGDTFLGSFLARDDLGDMSKMALEYAAAAAAIQVTRPGAAIAIPSHAEVTAFLDK